MTGTRNETGLTTTGIAGGIAAVLVVVVGIVVAVQAVGPDRTGPTSQDPTSQESTSGETTSPSATPDEGTPSEPTESRTQEAYVAEALTAAKDGFPAMVPAEIPDGWTAGAATYEKDSSWHMELTTPAGDRLVIEQRRTGMARLVQAMLGRTENRPTVNLTRWGTGRWEAFATEDSYALAKELAATAVVVSGDAPPQDVVALTKQLLTAEVAVNVGDGSDG